MVKKQTIKTINQPASAGKKSKWLVVIGRVILGILVITSIWFHVGVTQPLMLEDISNRYINQLTATEQASKKSINVFLSSASIVDGFFSNYASKDCEIEVGIDQQQLQVNTKNLQDVLKKSNTIGTERYGVFGSFDAYKLVIKGAESIAKPIAQLLAEQEQLASVEKSISIFTKLRLLCAGVTSGADRAKKVSELCQTLNNSIIGWEQFSGWMGKLQGVVSGFNASCSESTQGKKRDAIVTQFIEMWNTMLEQVPQREVWTQLAQSTGDEISQQAATAKQELKNYSQYKKKPDQWWYWMS